MKKLLIIIFISIVGLLSACGRHAFTKENDPYGSEYPYYYNYSSDLGSDTF